MSTGGVKVMDRVENDFRKLKCGDDKPEREEILPLRMNYLTPAMMKEARDKLNETDEIKKEALAELRSKIEAEKDLVSPTNDTFLLAFLRARKYDVKKAFKVLQNYWRFRKDYDKYFVDPDIAKGDALISRNFIGLLDYRDKNGCTVLIVRIGIWDPDLDAYETLFRMISAILVYSQEHEPTQVMGFRIVFDFRGVSWKQMKYCTPGNALLLIRSTQFCYPARYKGVHILCDGKWIKWLWSMVYPLLTAKLKQRVFFHGVDLKPLRQFIHPSVIPEELGGEGPPFSNELFLESISSQSDRVVDQLNYGYKN